MNHWMESIDVLFENGVMNHEMQFIGQEWLIYFLKLAKWIMNHNSYDIIYVLHKIDQMNWESQFL